MSSRARGPRLHARGSRRRRSCGSGASSPALRVGRDAGRQQRVLPALTCASRPTPRTKSPTSRRRSPATTPGRGDRDPARRRRARRRRLDRARRARDWASWSAASACRCSPTRRTAICPQLQHARPLRPPHRRGRLPSGLSRADGASRSAPACTRSPGQRGATARFVARAALNYLWNQAENGTACPVTMTFAAVQVLRNAPDARRGVGAEAARRRLRPAARCRSPQKRGATVGMAMTEKQGGSDLRANADRAAQRATARSRSTATSGSARRR